MYTLMPIYMYTHMHISIKCVYIWIICIYIHIIHIIFFYIMLIYSDSIRCPITAGNFHMGKEVQIFHIVCFNLCLPTLQKHYLFTSLRTVLLLTTSVFFWIALNKCLCLGAMIN